ALTFFVCDPLEVAGREESATSHAFDLGNGARAFFSRVREKETPRRFRRGVPEKGDELTGSGALAGSARLRACLRRRASPRRRACQERPSGEAPRRPPRPSRSCPWPRSRP